MDVRMARGVRRCAFALSLALSYGSLASAQGTAGDRAAAEALFKEGKRLAADGKFELACPKFEESQKLDPGIGTQFNLANCYERSGRTASAWTSFLEVAGSARASGQKERERVARERAKTLEAQLVHLSVIVPAEVAGTPGLEIRRNGVLVGKAQWSVAVPVDPGSYTLEATAPGKKPWRVTADLSQPGSQRELTVGALETVQAVPVAKSPAPAPKPDTPSDRAASDTGATRRTLGLVVGGAGVVGIGVGTVLALSAKSTFDDADAECNEENFCTPKGVALREDAVSRGNVATLVFGVGSAALIGGAVLWLTAPSRDAAAARAPVARVQVGVGPGQVRVRGTW
jgi:hypothetical protein